MILPIVLLGDPVLRVKCKPVLEVTDEIRTLVKDMLETMHDARGVGLAAPQIGRDIQLAVIDVSHDPECVSYVKINDEDRVLADIMPLVILNPVMDLHKDKVFGEEGCLSIPYIRQEVRRAAGVKVTFKTLDGEVQTVESDGLLARALQHEIDHLNGVLFIDRVSAAAKIGLKRKLRNAKLDWAEDIAAGKSLYRSGAGED